MLKINIKNILLSSFFLCLIYSTVLNFNVFASFQIQTGYYVGNGVSGLQISGIGFQPDFVLIRPATASGTAVFKTSSMPSNVTADNTASQITLNTSGFTLGTISNVNSVNIYYRWLAIAGSDCSASGTFCVGTYTGDGTSIRSITVGFQPSVVIVKRSTAVAAHLRTNSQPVNQTIFLNSNATDNTGNYIRNFGTTDFQVGSLDNVNGATYYYITFANVSGIFAEGVYTGDGIDNRNINVGFEPDFAFVKNATNATAANRRPVINFIESFGESSSHVGDNISSIVDAIQGFNTNGFTVGTSPQVNQLGDTFYWFAIKGVSNYSPSGSFQMATGNYTGNGTNQNITGLGFDPDMIIIKSDINRHSVFRTRTMQGDSTAYLASATGNFTGGITSFITGGFSVGSSNLVNANGETYRWIAFGNAFNPYTNTGANDFAIGAYFGNGIDNRIIGRLPFNPDFVLIKRFGASSAVWRTTNISGDNTLFLLGNPLTSDLIQNISSNTFEIGTNAIVNANGNIYHWVAFKIGSNFNIGTYTGSGSSTNITSVGFRPELVWIKHAGSNNGVFASTAINFTLGLTQYFVNANNITSRITGFYKNGFSLGGNLGETNLTGNTYYYAAWNNSNYSFSSVDIVDSSGNSVSSPSTGLSNTPFSFDCTSSNGILGTSSQRIRIIRLGDSPQWNLSISATSSPTALWQNTSATQFFDFNDNTSSGCVDGGDPDSFAGQMSIDATSAIINGLQVGCTATGISFGSGSFVQGSTDSITLATATASADNDCYWDLTNININQVIPPEVTLDNYTINLTLTLVAI